MKKLFILLLILLFSSISNAQSSSYICSKTEISVYNNLLDKWETRVVEEDANIKITIESNIIIIHAKAKSIISVGKNISKKEEQDYTSDMFNAYDYESGETCKVCFIRNNVSGTLTLMVFKSLKSRELALTYELN
jgi:hypothetical protein